MQKRASSETPCLVKFPPKPPPAPQGPSSHKRHVEQHAGKPRPRSSSVSAAPGARGVQKNLQQRTDVARGSGNSSAGPITAIFGRSRTLVFPPTGWVPSRSDMEPPDRELVRQYVFGYNADTKHSVHFVSDDEIAYPVSGLVVINNIVTNQQRFYEGHNTDVTCLAWNETRQLCASGQTDVKGAGRPFICVWSPKYCEQTIAHLSHHEKCVSAVGISEDGRTIVSVGGDDQHTLCVWRTFASWDGRSGPPPSEFYQDRALDQHPPIYSISSGREPTHSVFMWPSAGDEISFHTLGDRSTGLGSATGGHFRHWTITRTGGGRGTNPGDVSQKRGTFGMGSSAGNPTHMAIGADAGSVWMASHDGRLYTVRGSAAVSDIKVSSSSTSGGPVPLGCVAALPGRRWIVGAQDGTIYLGCMDERSRMRVTERFPAAELGDEAHLFCSTTVPRFSTVSVRTSQNLAVFGTSNHALLILSLGPPLQVMQVLQVSHVSEAWALDFHPRLEILATASDAKDLRFWNVGERRPRIGIIYKTDSGVGSLAFSPNGSLLALGCNNGSVEVLGFPSLLRAYKQIISKLGKEISDIKFSLHSHHGSSSESEGMLLAAACADCNVYLLKVVLPAAGGPAHVKFHKALSGNSSAIGHIMFSSDGEYIMSNSRDTQILFWRTQDGLRQTKISAFRDTQWQHPWSCVLGWPVIAIWSDPDYDGTDINTVCQSYPPDDGSMVVGDDLGKLKLFRYPNPCEDPPCETYGGHSSHVTKVKFSCSNVLAALGGDDHSISLWTLKRKREERPRPQEHLQHPWMQLGDDDFQKEDRFAFLGRTSGRGLQGEAGAGGEERNMPPRPRSAGSVTSSVRQQRRQQSAPDGYRAAVGAGLGAAADQNGLRPGANIANLGSNAGYQGPREFAPGPGDKPAYYRNESYGVGGAMHHRDAEAIRNGAIVQAGTPGTAGRPAAPYRRNESRGVGDAMCWD